MLECAHFRHGERIAVDVSADQILLKAATPEREVRVIQKDGRLVITGALPLTDADVISAIEAGRDERNS